MIIGLSGYARSGKDTVAGMLIGLHGYENCAFAEPIRKAVYALNPMVKDFGYTLKGAVDAYGWDVAKTMFPEIRRLLQAFGTEVGRELFDEDFWVNQAFKGLNVHSQVVFTDVRFPNEAARIKLYGGQVWRITRLGVGPINNHKSETALDNWDFDRTITNDADLQTLQDRINEALA
jgi:hypothetical protein